MALEDEILMQTGAELGDITLKTVPPHENSAPVAEPV